MTTLLASLKTKSRWVCWRLINEKKIPFAPRLPLVEARVNNESTWGTHEEALALVNAGHVDGKGYVLGDGEAGVDLDDCRNPENGELTPEAQQIIAALNSYTEVSPSQRGVKVFVSAWVAKNHARKGLEIYGHGRYFTVTEQHLEAMPTNAEPRASEIESLITREFPAASAPARATRRASEPIRQGKRNDTLFRLAAAMRRQGFDGDAILAALIQHSKAHCDAPMERRELETIARSGSRYEPAHDTFPTTETGDAEFFASIFGDRVRFDWRQGRWLVFAGHRWITDSDGELHRLATEAIRARQAAAFALNEGNERKDRLKWAIAGESRRRHENVIALARSKPPLSDPGDGWDSTPMWLAAPNGIIELETGALRPGRAADRITMSVRVPYDPDAACPLWERTVEEVFAGDADLISYFQRALGYSICGDCREECLFMCWGAGRNGKGTLLNTVGYILGDHADNLSFSALELHERSGVGNEIAKLVAKRYVTASESGEASRLNEARIKALTGRDPITARFLYREEFTFQPDAKFWLSTNAKPIVRDSSDAFWQRLHLIPFTQSFAGREDRTLKDRLRAEASGILAWLVRGCVTWQREGLRPPDVVRQATQAYRDESDPLADFYDARCVIRSNVQVKAVDLHNDYAMWAAKAGITHRFGSKTFFKRVAQRFGKPDEKRDGRWYQGIGIRVSEIEPATSVPQPGEDLF